MAPATHYPCPLCNKLFVKDFFIQNEGKHICCLLGEIISKVSEKIDKLGAVFDTVQTRIVKLDTTGISIVLEKAASVI